MPEYSCSELISKGLLHDEEAGRFNTKGVEYFVPTDLATWLLEKINELNAS